MDIRIFPFISGGEILMPPSKSEVIRATLAALLAETPTRIVCSGMSDDLSAVCRVAVSLGGRIEYSDDGFTVIPPEAFPEAPTLDVGESATLLRMLIPVCAALGLRANIIRRSSLASRPVGELCGISIEEADGLLTVKSRLAAGNYFPDSSITSQNISGLLFALSVTDGESRLDPGVHPVSAPYIEMSARILRTFGASVEKRDGVYIIYGRKKLSSPKIFRVGGDYSAAAFFLALASVSGKNIKIKGLSQDSPQGDADVTEILKRAGVGINVADDALCASGRPHPIKFSAYDTPDLVPPLATLACFADGISVIGDVGRLRYKESDRVTALCDTLSALGADIRVEKDDLIIRGKPTLRGGECRAYGDHRIAMAAAVVSAGCENPVTIRGAECVSKSFPGFFDVLGELGMKTEVVNE